MTPARAAPAVRRRCMALLLMLLAAGPWAGPAAADEKLRQSDVVWKQMDNCTRAAIKAYPDYTAEALAKREAQRRLCLRRSNLPGGDDPPAPDAAAASGDISK
ncbi:MAG TPA: hypothetical protein VJO12_06555 [Stellaceae bacterium]|nr:hypothetical protein [Stellaceae bacterium]